MVLRSAPPPDDESSPRYFGWRVVVACFLMALACWGFGLYGHSVYLAELTRLHGWPPSLISGASTATYLLNAVLVIFTSNALARFGARRFVLSGVAALAIALSCSPPRASRGRSMRRISRCRSAGSGLASSPSRP